MFTQMFTQTSTQKVDSYTGYVHSVGADGSLVEESAQHLRGGIRSVGPQSGDVSHTQG